MATIHKYRVPLKCTTIYPKMHLCRSRCRLSTLNSPLNIHHIIIILYKYSHFYFSHSFILLQAILYLWEPRILYLIYRVIIMRFTYKGFIYRVINTLFQNHFYTLVKQRVENDYFATLKLGCLLRTYYQTNRGASSQ